MDKIDSIVYINLDSRTDRNDKMLCELYNFKKYDTKISRISACSYPQNPAVGCLMSHIVALKHALTDELNEMVLILEDDFSFTVNEKILNEILEDFFDRSVDWDCILLSYGYVETTPYDDLISYSKVATMASGYLIKRKAIVELVDVYIHSLVSLIQTDKDIIFAADRIWQKLMKNNRWFIFNRRLGVQCVSYSDITKTMRDDLREQMQNPPPKVFIIHRNDKDISLLRNTLTKYHVKFIESEDFKKFNDKEYRVVIILNVKINTDIVSPETHIILNPKIHDRLTFVELLAQ